MSAESDRLRARANETAERYLTLLALPEMSVEQRRALVSLIGACWLDGRSDGLAAMARINTQVIEEQRV